MDRPYFRVYFGGKTTGEVTNDIESFVAIKELKNHLHKDEASGMMSCGMYTFEPIAQEAKVAGR